MAFSRTARIWTLLIIDSVFLLIELVVGYAVGSLALVADAFHMLNDVLSLVVALYAIKLSTNSPTPKYSYGWHRAEILAALVNGVFLLALCLSIFLEAIERFFSIPEISNPKLVVIVGSLGLASNVLGLFLFHEHGHAHDHGSKSPSEDPSGLNTPQLETSLAHTETTPLLVSPTSPQRIKSPRLYDPPTPYGHPAQNRTHVVQAAEQAGYKRFNPGSVPRDASWSNSFLRSPVSARPVPEDAMAIEVGEPASDDESLTVAANKSAACHTGDENCNCHHHAGGDSETHRHDHDHRHQDHEETLARRGYGNATGGGHSHSHGSMNMHALLLHVLGDALGNVGVIASGLIIWLSDWQYKFLSDPIISLVITVIIFTSALPLVKSASFILLQGVPTSITLEDLREDIRRVRGVVSVHELHVWQLSEAKIIASVHVCVDRGVEYMKVAADIREVLHAYNVHSCTIQPEYDVVDNEGKPIQKTIDDENHCLLPCPPGSACHPDSACCPTPPRSASRPQSR